MANYRGWGAVLILLGICIVIEIFVNAMTLGSYKLAANRVIIFGTLALAGFLLIGGLVVFFNLADKIFTEPRPKYRKRG
jgi:hypothetical protein